MSKPELVHYRGGRIFTADEPAWAESLVVRGESIEFVGDTATADGLADGARLVDLGGAFVLPGFVDAHTHLLGMGEALRQVDLFDAADVAEIQARIGETAAADPGAPRILGRSWLFGALDGRGPDRGMIDAAVPDRPVYLVANDLHSTWVNSAALRELGITADTPDPIGGRIGRDEAGEPDGMLYEAAALQLARRFLDAEAGDDERDAALASTFEQYLADGVTGAVDMGLGQDDLDALERALARGDGRLPLRVAGHWLVERTGRTEDDLRQVRRAVELAGRLSGPWLRVTGIKLLVDGVIDSCTAAMKAPFADGSHPGPIWDLAALSPVVAAADAAGMQVALHAIGDEASDIALSALEHAIETNGPRDRRHRLEHVEVVTEENVRRLAGLGVVASMQPVHADPAIQDNWRAVLGDDRVRRGYPWPELTAAGAVLAFGSDAPTAPHPPLPNMFIATTRRSASDPGLPANIPEYALPLADALAHGTRHAAYSCRWEELTGRLAPGLAADFVVLDHDPFAEGADSLLRTKIRLTVVAGEERAGTLS
ncbi:amidohydrolase [Amycolatopsis sp. lyj-90]|uniref:amidohydrolase n=1 Tax=Amycolatopsis sp. lyj-90 TaxID=2789285 RepID=UPI00397BF321